MEIRDREKWNRFYLPAKKNKKPVFKNSSTKASEKDEGENTNNCLWTVKALGYDQLPQMWFTEYGTRHLSFWSLFWKLRTMFIDVMRKWVSSWMGYKRMRNSDPSVCRNKCFQCVFSSRPNNKMHKQLRTRTTFFNELAAHPTQKPSLPKTHLCLLS